MCKTCDPLNINGVLCHEQGCPSAWEGEERTCLWCSAKDEYGKLVPLKRCPLPWCTCDDRSVVWGFRYGQVYVYCQDCRTESEPFQTREQAAEQWNKDFPGHDRGFFDKKKKKRQK